MNSNSAELGEDVAVAETRKMFIDKIGSIVQAEGMPRIAGRVFALLLFDGDAISYNRLTQELMVSKGSISSSVKLLEDLHVINRVGKPGDRQEYVRIADNAFAKLLNVSAYRARQAQGDIDQTIAELPDWADGARRRLSQYSGFYEELATALIDAAHGLKKR